MDQIKLQILAQKVDKFKEEHLPLVEEDLKKIGSLPEIYEAYKAEYKKIHEMLLFTISSKEESSR